METLDQSLVSSWFDVQSVPQTFVHPPEKRPGNSIDVPPCKNIPVVDLGSRDRSRIIQQISKASQDFGFFQVINHGVCKKLIDNIMSISKEFHKMPQKDKIIEGSKDPSGRCKFYTSSENYANEEVHYWRDALTHPAHSSENYMQFLPQKPTQYREVFKAYVDEVRTMGSMILEMLAEGLGLSKEFFNGGLIENPTLLSNHYPPCPDPTLTLGLKKHRDPSLITILLQDSEGLQVFKDGNWIGVEPISSGFVVNIGYVMQMISNSKFKGAEHRVVTNSRAARTTIAYFIYPSNETVIEPANVLCNPPLYRSMKFTEFLQHFKSKAANDEEMSKIDLEPVDQKLVSSWYDVQSVPQTFVQPPEKWPGKDIDVPLCKNIPVVDLRGPDWSRTIEQISEAIQEFGFFQVINHGVSKKLIDDTMNVSKDFHAMPRKDKETESSKDPSGRCKFYTSSENYANEEVHYWGDALVHPADSSENYMQYLPEKPTRYRQVVKAFMEELRKLGSVILEMLAEGLGLNKDFFNGGLTENPTLMFNHYPLCPDPSLTLGLKAHRDASIITILLQDSEGLQVFKDGNWFRVEPISNAFVVNIGYAMQMISNSKFKGAEHRVVTNSRDARTTVAYFVYPSNETVIEPAKALCNPVNPPLYKCMTFAEFIRHFYSTAADPEELLKVLSLTE